MEAAIARYEADQHVMNQIDVFICDARAEMRNRAFALLPLLCRLYGVRRLAIISERKRR